VERVGADGGGGGPFWLDVARVDITARWRLQLGENTAEERTVEIEAGGSLKFKQQISGIKTFKKLYIIRFFYKLINYN
jgi:hypothetical protein